jgi:monovalent cation:H+ antiporter-2, CPA2 family
VLAFVGIALAASRWLARPLDRLLDRLSLEFFLLFTLAFVVGMAALAEELGLSGAIGALMAGIILAETTIREQVEERFFSFRDVFAALFFFAFGLSIDLGAIGDVGWLVALAVVPTVVGKLGGGFVAGAVGGFSRRQSLSTGAALVAHGEFTIILAQVASENPSLAPGQQTDLVAFAGLYVLATATIGLALMKESKRIARALFPTTPRLTEEA